MDFNHETHYITNIYRNNENEEPALRASESDNSITIFTGWNNRKYLLKIQTPKGEDGTKNALIGGKLYTMDIEAKNKLMGILFVESSDKNSLQMFLYNDYDRTCFLEVVYNSKSNSVNIYPYKDGNRGELIRSFVVS